MSSKPPNPSSLARIRLVRRLSRRLDLPMALLSLAFLVLVIIQLATGPDEPHALWIETAIWGIWGVFVLEFIAKLLLYPDRREYLRRRFFDVLVLVFPMLRVLTGVQALRGLRVFRGLGVGRTAGHGMWLFRMGIALRRGGRAFAHFWQRSRFGLVLAATGVLVVFAAALMTLLERGAPESPIHNFGQALWWSAAIVTTVASDLNPVTPGGRILAVVMMVYGMAVFGYLISQIVAVIQEPGKPTPKPPPS